VLGEDISDAAVDGAPAGHHAIAGDARLLHAEIDAAVLDIHVELLKGVLVEQELEPLARGELAAGMLGLDASEPAALPCPAPPNFKLFQDFLHAAPQAPVTRSCRSIAWGCCGANLLPVRETRRMATATIAAA